MKEIIKAEFNEIYVENEKDIDRLQKTEVEINALTLQANQMALTYIIAIGSRLKEAKEMVNHGQWGAWCSEKINYSQSTAENYIKIYEEYGSEQMSLLQNANSETIMKLPYSKALALIAVPADEREKFIEENNVEDLSVRELKDLLKKKEDETENLEDKINSLEAEKEKITADIIEKENKIKELESNISQLDNTSPSTNDLDKLRKEIEEDTKKEYEEKLKKLKAEKSELEKTVKEREKQIDEIREDSDAEIKTLKNYLSEAQSKAESLKSAAESSGILQIINMHLENFQECFAKLSEELEKLKTENAETYEKIRSGILCIIKDYENSINKE